MEQQDLHETSILKFTKCATKSKLDKLAWKTKGGMDGGGGVRNRHQILLALFLGEKPAYNIFLG